MARPLAEGADDDLARVDAHPHVQACPVGRLDLVGDLREGLDHRPPGSHGPHGVVLLGDAQPEDRHRGVADELLDDPAVRLDDALPPQEALVDDLTGVLGVEPAGEDGEPLEVGEEDGDEPPLLPGEAVAEGVAPFAERGEGGLDDLGPEGTTLRLEGGDRRLDLEEGLAGKGAGGAGSGMAPRITTHQGRWEGVWWGGVRPRVFVISLSRGSRTDEG